MGPRVCPRCVPGGKLRRGPESSPKGVQRGAGNGHEGVHIRAGKDICPVGVGWRRGSSQPISRPSASSASATSSVASRNADRSRSGEPDAAAPPLDLAVAPGGSDAPDGLFSPFEIGYASGLSRM
eukprot:875682-Pyramimonas_sp.AAC.1